MVLQDHVSDVPQEADPDHVRGADTFLLVRQQQQQPRAGLRLLLPPQQCHVAAARYFIILHKYQFVFHIFTYIYHILLKLEI